MAIICRDYKLLFILVPATGSSAIAKVLINNFKGEWIPKKNVHRNSERVIKRKHNDVKSLVRNNLLTRKELDSYLKFATIRNPFDRIATAYQRDIGGWKENTAEKQKTRLEVLSNPNKIAYLEKRIRRVEKHSKWAQNTEFEVWIEYFLGLHRKVSWLTNAKSKIKSLLNPYYMPRAYPLLEGVDEIIRYENLEADLNRVLKKADAIQKNEHISIPKYNPTPGRKSYQEYYSPEARAIVEKVFEKELSFFNYSFD